MAGRYMGLVFILLAIASLLPVAPLSYLSIKATAQQDQRSTQMNLEPYVFYGALYTNTSIQAMVAASIPGRGVVAVSGADIDSGGYSLEVIRVDPLSRAAYISKHAVSGTPTAMASDGDYGSYIAVGTERGDVVVYNAQSGGVSYIQASRYAVKRLSIGVGASGDPYLAVLDSQGYLYLYRASRGGWAEVGPLESTAVYNYTSAVVLDISGTEAAADGRRSVDPSLLLMIYRPPSIRVSFLIYNETGYPVNNSVVTAILAKPRAQVDLVLQTISRQDGSAEIDLPLIDPVSTVYNVSITHPSYETYNISIELNKGLLGKGLTYIVAMRSGQGVVTPIAENPRISFAALLDASAAPESIRFGKPLLLTIEPIYAKLIKPDVRGTPWTYIGVIVGYMGDRLVAAFTYFDRSLNPVLVGSQGYVWYVLPSISGRVWMGYDDDGQGISVMLGSGRIYYFLYNAQRSFHLAFWGVDVPGSIVSADYRNGVLISIDGSGGLHISRVDPERSIECTRGSSYFGVPVGPGIASWLGSGFGYLATSSRVYLLSALQSIVSGRCSIELVRIYPRVVVNDLISNYSLEVSDGYVDVYEGDSLVARGLIVNGSSLLYLPRGAYVARVSSSVIEYSRSFEVSGSSVELPGPTLYRVRVFLYHYNPESPYTGTLSRVPPGLTLSIDDRINITTSENPLDLLLEGGDHRAALIDGGVVLASTEFAVSKSGSLNLVLRTSIARINVSVRVLETGFQAIPVPEESITLRLVAEGPLLSGDLGVIKPGSLVSLPLGVYRVVATSPFFYDEEVVVGIARPGSLENVEVSLRPREIQARLLVVDDFGEPVPNASVAVMDSLTRATIFSGVTSSDGALTIPRVFLGDYLVSVRPSNESLYIGYSGLLKIDRQDLVVSINRTRQNVTIALVDPISGGIISPVRISIYMGDRLLSSSNLSETSVISNLSLPHGSARIVVEPAGQPAIYNRIEVNTTIAVGGGRIEVTLTRRILDITLRVVNDLDQPIKGASITIRSTENPAIEITQETDDEGKAALRLPYGSYEITASAPGYNRLETQIPAGEQSVTIKLQPTLLNLLSRYTIAYIAIGMVAAIIIVARIARRYIERKAREEAM